MAQARTADVRSARRRSRLRLLVHLGLVATTVVSLVFEPVLTLHIVLGFAFLVFVVAHLLQRRRVSGNLARRVTSVRRLVEPAGRLAMADALLAALVLGMFVSGMWDWLAGHPTKIRWHAITGVVLTAVMLVHTVRRRSRLRRSQVR